MQIDWLELRTAFALYLVIEGVLPFLSPQGMKRTMALFASLPAVTPATTPDELVEHGLIARPPKDLQRALDQPRYREGRELFVRTTVTFKDQGRRGVGFFAAEGEVAFTHRAVLRAQRDEQLLVDVEGAAELLPLPHGSIDAAWSVNAMHHWVDPAVAATEITRVLRPGGRVILVDEDFEDPQHPEHERFKARHRAKPGGDGIDGDADTEGSESTLNRHGFTTVDAAAMGRLLASAGLVEAVRL